MSQLKLFDSDMELGAVFSECRLYRYALWRKWGEGNRMVAFCGLNCSTADEILDDNTVRRCIRFARGWGFDGMFMLNAYAFRATDPKVMKKADDPIGPDNDRFLAEYAQKSEMIVAAWGNICSPTRAKQVIEILGNVHCLALNANGAPKHPLYVRGDVTPKPYSLPANLATF